MNDSLIGTQIGGYRVERLLGRGGMASVYFAWDTNNNRPVALKVMDERYRDTPSYVDRFIHEAQTIASWDHPNIVRVLDAGEENGIYYYAMEFIRGLDLAQLLRQYLEAGQLLPFNEVVRIGWAVANALDFAHVRGIIHRDVKPSNILISVDSRVLLSDFGLVMDINRGTMGETFGSPAYIAPEQARSSAGAVPQSDNYALGVILYEMLTGVVPFYDDSPAALALKHLNEEPPRPRALNPRLNPGIEAVLLRALRKRPEERYATGREMMLALDHALGDELHTAEASEPMPLSPETQVLRTVRSQPPGYAAPAPNPAARRPNRISPSEAATAVQGAAVFPGPQTRQQNAPYNYANSVPQGPNATSVRPAYRPAPPPASYGMPPAGSIPVPPGGMGPPRRRGLGWGCLTALGVFVVLAVFFTAAMAAFRPSLPPISSLFGFPGLNLQPTATTQPTGTPVPPTATRKPTATRAPSKTPPPPTATPTATATPAPTDTSAPTDTPSATAVPVYNLLLARQKTDGFVLINTGKQPMPLANLQIENDSTNVPFSAADWNVDTLQPGQCVAGWVKGGKPKMPSGVSCKPVGKVLYYNSDSRFWTGAVTIYYNNAAVATCPASDLHCDFDTQPQ